jgi:hypothetical protein
MKRKGICYVCGCTHDDPCPEGCGWANAKQTLCTACEPLSTEERESKRKDSLEQLRMGSETAIAEAEDCRLRIDVLESNSR